MPPKKLDSSSQQLVGVEQVTDRILIIRGQRVMLDRDLAELYGVKTIALRQQVKRNLNRFPQDFMFQLTTEEAETLVSQFVIPSRRSFGGFLPYAFSQEGVAMLSSVLRSTQAVEVNIAIMRAFVRLRSILAVNKELARKIDALERSTAAHKELTAARFTVVFKFINDYLKSKRQLPAAIGFRIKGKK